MGVLATKPLVNAKVFAGAANNLISKANGCRVRLENGLFPNKEPQRNWTSYGRDQFIIETLGTLASMRTKMKRITPRSCCE